jgi:phospholipid transport system substrate-binding protein
MRRILCALCLSFLAAGVTTTTAAQSPLDLVRETSEEVLSKLRADKEKLQKDPALLYGLIQDYVLPHFDFQRMSRLVLGKYWRQASPDQRERFTDQFRTLLVRTYGTALLQYTDQTVKYLPLRAPPDATDVTVDTEVVQPSGPPIPVQYSLVLEGEEWKVYDVTIDGVSLVINYRGSFGDQIRKQGLDALIQKLAEKNKKEGS